VPEYRLAPDKQNSLNQKSSIFTCDKTDLLVLIDKQYIDLLCQIKKHTIPSLPGKYQYPATKDGIAE